MIRFAVGLSHLSLLYIQITEAATGQTSTVRPSFLRALRSDLLWSLVYLAARSRHSPKRGWAVLDMNPYPESSFASNHLAVWRWASKLQGPHL